MNPFERLHLIAREKRAKIVLPEGTDPRVIKAAGMLLKENFCTPILIGEFDKIQQIALEHQVVIDGAVIKHWKNEQNWSSYILEYLELRKEAAARSRLKGKNVPDPTLEEIEKQLQHPIFYGSMLVRKGIADGSVAGCAHPTADTIRAALHLIGLAPGIKVLSSSFLMVMPDGRIFTFADPAYIPNPTPEELASIGVSAAETHQKLTGETPLVAFLSYSTKGSAEGPSIDAVRKALVIAKELAPHIEMDGELQLDAAIVPKVAASKAPNSKVAGKANVLIFPDLNSGNIGYKLVNRLAGAEAIGPISQGLNKPAFDLSRGASSEEIAKTCIIAAALT
ncbi:MAG: phosphate acetyltransferase [bacterium]|nr:phosphate acetyltransferase [bacterium]